MYVIKKKQAVQECIWPFLRYLSNSKGSSCRINSTAIKLAYLCRTLGTKVRRYKVSLFFYSHLHLYTLYHEVYGKDEDIGYLQHSTLHCLVMALKVTCINPSQDWNNLYRVFLGPIWACLPTFCKLYIYFKE